MEIPYDLANCLEYNRVGIGKHEIARVLGVVEGDHDGPSWYWVLESHAGQCGVLVGGCDYTGWDCQSSAQWQRLPERNRFWQTDLLKLALHMAIDEDEYVRIPEIAATLYAQLFNRAPIPDRYANLIEKFGRKPSAP